MAGTSKGTSRGGGTGKSKTSSASKANASSRAGASSRSSSGRSAGSSSGRSSSGSKGTTKRRADKQVVDEIWAIVIIALGIFFILATFTDGAGSFGTLVGGTLKGIFGAVAYVLPFYLIVFGVLIIAKQTSRVSGTTILLLSLTLLMFCAINSIRFVDADKTSISSEAIKSFYETGKTLKSGGFFGMFIATLLVKWFGYIGCWLVTVVAALACILLLLNTPVSQYFAKISERVDEHRERKALVGEEDGDYEEYYDETTSLKYTQKMIAEEKRKKRSKDAFATNYDDGSEKNADSVKKDEEKAHRDIKIVTGLDGEQEEIDFENVGSGGGIVNSGMGLNPDSSASAEGRLTPEEEEKRLQENLIKYRNNQDLFVGRGEQAVGVGTGGAAGFGVENPADVQAGFGMQDSSDYQQAQLGGGYGLNGYSATVEAPLTGYGLDGRAGGRVAQSNEAGIGMDGAGNTYAEAGVSPKDRISDKAARQAMIYPSDSGKTHMGRYKKPPITLLEKTSGGGKKNDGTLKARAIKLEDTLKNFHVDARVVQVTQGPTVTRYEIQPAVGVKVNSIVRLADDIALNLEAKSIRIEAPIPGKAAVGIEVENDSVTMVHLRDIIDSAEFKNSKSKISFAVGKDISGKAIVGDLKGMPHLLIAGSTGSGKSVCINSIITSLLYKANPDEVKLILIDPKVVELGNYNGIPHLLIPVVTDPTKAAASLNWAVAEMNDRYKKFAEEGVRDLETYNESLRANGREDEVLPQVVIIIDELADLMMAAPSQIEESICRLAQMARAAGMHLIVATQRPSVDVITGVIKANIPSRIAFAVSSQVDSRTILDMQGAEKLVGKGDMLYNPIGMGKPIRVQGTFVSDKEVHKVIEFVKNQSDEIKYDDDLISKLENSGSQQGSGSDDSDELLADAVELVVRNGQASVSMLQRRFRIGYNRAARMVDMLEARGIIGPPEGSKPRRVLMSVEEYEQLSAAYSGKPVSQQSDLSEQSPQQTKEDDDVEDDAKPSIL